jgi:hypothetical protein
VYKKNRHTAISGRLAENAKTVGRTPRVKRRITEIGGLGAVEPKMQLRIFLLEINSHYIKVYMI